MSAAVTHINLLERRTPTLSVAAMLGTVLLLTGVGLFLHGRQAVSTAWVATEKRDALAAQIKGVQARLTASNDAQTRNATAVALRAEIETLQPQAQAAQALISAVRAAEGGRSDDFGRALAAATGVNEPGLWLTTLNLSERGKRLELQGQAHSGAPVLRFARRANEQLQPLTLHLDSLEMQPSAGSALGVASTAVQTVSFRLY